MNIRKVVLGWLALFAVAALTVFLVAACDGWASNVDGPNCARGGKGNVKYLQLDSLQVLPPYTELFKYDATLGVPPDSTQAVQFLVVYWEGDTPNLKREEDGLLYRVDMDAGCLIDRPKPKADGSDVVLVVTNLDTDEAGEPVLYDGVPGLRICPR